VLVLKNVGPIGYPGMPEVGNMALPKKLLEQGVEDIVRISDGRMSGTGFGTVVLHVSPESAAGGPLALVQDGDWITLDLEARTLQLDVDQTVLSERRAAWQPSHPVAGRGYVQLYQRHVGQAHQGADMDFLRGGSGSAVTRDSH
jgi:dihydroxy-acid dehydratase